METGLYVLIGLLAAWFLYRQFAPVKHLRTLNAEQFKSEAAAHRIIDVREAHEYKGGHIPGAVNMPLSVFGRRMNELSKDEPVYLYCQGGVRSKRAASQLSRSGYRQIAHLSGGIMSWRGPLQKK